MNRKDSCWVAARLQKFQPAVSASVDFGIRMPWQYTRNHWSIPESLLQVQAKKWMNIYNIHQYLTVLLSETVHWWYESSCPISMHFSGLWATIRKIWETLWIYARSSSYERVLKNGVIGLYWLLAFCCGDDRVHIAHFYALVRKQTPKIKSFKS